MYAPWLTVKNVVSCSCPCTYIIVLCPIRYDSICRKLSTMCTDSRWSDTKFPSLKQEHSTLRTQLEHQENQLLEANQCVDVYSSVVSGSCICAVTRDVEMLDFVIQLFFPKLERLLNHSFVIIQTRGFHECRWIPFFSLALVSKVQTKGEILEMYVLGWIQPLRSVAPRNKGLQAWIELTPQGYRYHVPLPISVWAGDCTAGDWREFT